jgi:histidinol phosphatase-like enzyme (inositol monophosphatase family)
MSTPARAPLPLPPHEAAEIAETAAAMAEAARAETLPRFRAAGLDVANKAEDGFDPVTEADRAAEAAMRAVLDARRPGDAIHGEELGRRAGESGLTWVIDPIDGTRAFLCGAPTWGTLIAVTDASGPVYGVIDQPFTGERWLGGLGAAEWRRDGAAASLATRATAELAAARLCSTFPEIGTAAERAAFERLSARVRLTRYGLDCYAYGLLAAGAVDLVVEAGLGAYDICAPIAVIEAAGGVVTDWQGRPAHGGGRVLAAANRTLHAAALVALAG